MKNCKVILINDSVYMITKIELNKLIKMQENLKNESANNKQYFKKEEELGNYLDDNKSVYKHIGSVDFMYRR